MSKREEPIICIKDLVTRVESTLVHDGLNLDIRENEILGLVGGSGAGKSVLVHTILGLLKPVSGHVYFKGRDIPSLSKPELLKTQKEWGVLFQSGALFSGLTVAENIEFPMIEHTDIPPALARELAFVKMRLVGLSREAANKYPAELSGGMVKRAALARALALEPQILFLDEPTSGLDPISAEAFDELIKHLQETLGLTVVIITHDIDTLVTICSRVAVLVDKKVVAGSLKEIKDHSHSWIQKYFHGARMRRLTNIN